MSSTAAKAKAKAKVPPLSDQGMHFHLYPIKFYSEPDQLEIQQNYTRLQNELQGLARKIGELESEADEHTSVFFFILAIFFSDNACHSLVLSTLDQTLAEEPDRKCFRLIGGVLVERTVRDITPALKTNRDGVCRF
jgi:prefoldin subunit 2